MSARLAGWLFAGPALLVIALFFGEVDGKSEVYVNGEKIAVPEQYQSPKKPGAPGAKPPRRSAA